MMQLTKRWEQQEVQLYVVRKSAMQNTVPLLSPRTIPSDCAAAPSHMSAWVRALKTTRNQEKHFRCICSSLCRTRPRPRLDGTSPLLRLQRIVRCCGSSPADIWLACKSDSTVPQCARPGPSALRLLLPRSLTALASSPSSASPPIAFEVGHLQVSLRKDVRCSSNTLVPLVPIPLLSH